MAVRKRKLTWFLDKLTEPESEKGRAKATIPDSVCERIFERNEAEMEGWQVIGFGIFFLFVVVLLFSLTKSAGMAERKFEELQRIHALNETDSLDIK